jgi:hypothetical protein
VTATIAVLERGERIEFSFADMLRHHAGNSLGGVAHAFKVLERALPLLDAGDGVERRQIVVRTAFGGPGARDAFELVTGAVSDGRYVVDQALARPERGFAIERFVFALAHRGRSATLAARPGTVTDEFVALARRDGRSAEEERRLDALKREMAERVLASPAEAVYERLA